MDGPRDCHTKWSKSERDKYHMILLLCGILKNDSNELIYKTEIDSQTFWLTKGIAGGHGAEIN